MFLIAGLGNPGEKYTRTRHNVGFMTLDAFQLKHDFMDFKLDKKSNSLISEGLITDEKVILAKPQTFMNNSGAAVKSLYTKYKILDTRYLILVHDDIDLPVGTIRISANSGSAGHKGVESVIQHLGTQDFPRVRIGIQPQIGKPKNVEAFVLKKFAKEELSVIENAIQHTCDALASLLTEGIERAMNEYNK